MLRQSASHMATTAKIVSPVLRIVADKDSLSSDVVPSNSQPPNLTSQTKTSAANEREKIKKTVRRIMIDHEPQNRPAPALVE